MGLGGARLSSLDSIEDLEQRRARNRSVPCNVSAPPTYLTAKSLMTLSAEDTSWTVPL
jgi:hypothetical protein